MACTQTRISYNWFSSLGVNARLWLALRRGSVTIAAKIDLADVRLWLALRRGSVTMRTEIGDIEFWLWLALRRGSVTI